MLDIIYEISKSHPEKEDYYEAIYICYKRTKEKLWLKSVWIVVAIVAKLYTSKTTATTITESLNDFNRSGFSSTLCLSYNKLKSRDKNHLSSLDLSIYFEMP